MHHDSALFMNQCQRWPAPRRRTFRRCISAPSRLYLDPDEEEHLEDIGRLELGLRAVVLELGEVARDCAEEEQLEAHDDRAVHEAVEGLLSAHHSLITHGGQLPGRKAAEGRGDQRLLEAGVVLEGVDVVEVDEQRQEDEENLDTS